MNIDRLHVHKAYELFLESKETDFSKWVTEYVAPQDIVDGVTRTPLPKKNDPIWVRTNVNEPWKKKTFAFSTERGYVHVWGNKEGTTYAYTEYSVTEPHSCKELK